MSNTVDFNDYSGQRKAELQRAVDSALNAAGQVVADDIKELAPVDSGKLKGSIKKSLAGKGNDTEVTVYTNLNYAAYVEFGTGEFAENGMGRKTPWVYKSGDKYHRTKGMRGQKFMRNGFRNAKPKARRVIETIVGGAFK